MRRFASVLAVAASVIVVAVAAGPAVGSAVGSCVPGTGWPGNHADLASQVVSLVNSHRQQLGLSTLHVSPTLTKSAVWKAEHMAEYQYMQHDDPAPPVARTVAQRLDACGYPGDTSGWGENIAYGYQTAQDVMTGWLNSPGHKANIENSTYRSIGVGAATAANGAIYWAQDFGTVDDSGTTTGPTSPTVTLTSKPAASGAPQTVSFAWTTTGTVSSTTCSLDGAVASACTTPKSYSGLAAGSHTFRVTVSNSGGSASASYTWSVATSTGTAAPTVKLTSTPPASGAPQTASFAWTTTGTVSSTTCSLDGATASACTTPKSYSALAAGSHTFRVTVSSSGGSASASYTWSVAAASQGSAPTVQITSAKVSAFSTSASFSWTTTGTVTSTTCSLDGVAKACVSPTSYYGLARGSHTFRVTVANASGSASSSTTWSVFS